MTVCKIYSNARFHLQSVEEFIDTYESKAHSKQRDTKRAHTIKKNREYIICTNTTKKRNIEGMKAFPGKTFKNDIER